MSILRYQLCGFNKIIISSLVSLANSFREKVDEVKAHLEEICPLKDIAILLRVI